VSAPMTLEVILMIGLQASGKSTFCRANFAKTHTYISRDQFPKSVKNPAARQRLLMEEALSQGQSVVVDNTHPTKEMRAEVLSLAKKYQARCVGYYFASVAKDCVARNSLREGDARVPDVAIFATIKKLEKPSLEEGFDQLFYVSLVDGGGFQIEPWI
jgi:predicted kinase